jgi:endoglucanase
MKKRIPFVLIFLLGACMLTSGGSSGTVTVIPTGFTSTEEPASVIAHPFPQHVEYVPNSILPNHRTQEQLDDDVRAFYDDWETEYLIQDGISEGGFPLYYVAFGKDESVKKTTVSEGQGYGMLIVPLMAGHEPEAQIIFDGL